MKYLFLPICMAFALVSCTDDPNQVTNEALQGTWEITSMTLGGQEQLGADTNKYFINEASVEFLRASDANGTWTKEAVILKGGGNERVNTTLGTYAISNEGKSLKMTDRDKNVLDFEVSIEGDSYSFTGTDNDNNALTEKATKK